MISQAAESNPTAGLFRVRRLVDAGYVPSHASVNVTQAAGRTTSGPALGAWRA